MVFLLLLPMVHAQSDGDQIRSYSNKFLIPIKLGSHSGNYEKIVDGIYKITSKISEDPNYYMVKVNETPVVKLGRFSKEESVNLFEVFDKRFLLISKYKNLGAAGSEMILRENVHIIALHQPSRKIQIASNEPIQFLQSRRSHQYFRKGSFKPNIYLIQDILDNRVEFLNLKNELIGMPLMVTWGLITIE
ncbi:MAG: hypothetical protein AAFP76_04710 [Bacteroidota bacterium]